MSGKDPSKLKKNAIRAKNQVTPADAHWVAAKKNGEEKKAMKFAIKTDVFMVGPVSMFFISSPVWTGSITLYRISISNDIFDKRRLALFSTDIKSIIYIDCNSIAIIAIFNDF